MLCFLFDQVWQHCHCMNISPDDAEKEDFTYVCEICNPRSVDREILDPTKKDELGPEGEEVEQYLTLTKDHLQIAQGDCVYIMRDFKRPARASMRLVAASNPDKMDIFRVEDLYKNSK